MVRTKTLGFLFLSTLSPLLMAFRSLLNTLLVLCAVVALPAQALNVYSSCVNSNQVALTFVSNSLTTLPSLC
ncbi:hypothetical protein L218DRAFT_635203 [Marasmius fiardii PR-910]|nr:hypothetical protein L218DRAFT_635203 [Marasmius fiardii PR-910]